MSIYFVWWWSITLKKKTENCIIARRAWCKVSVIFQVIVLSPNTHPSKSKFIPYHFITSYYVIRFMFHIFILFCFCTIFCGACVFYDVFICITYFFLTWHKITPIFQSIVQKRVAWKIKWLKKWQETLHLPLSTGLVCYVIQSMPTSWMTLYLHCTVSG
jgi:hypothetical protein